MGKYVLWRLNRVARWDPEPLLEALARPRPLSEARHQVRYGDRKRFNLLGEPSLPGALMHEGALVQPAPPMSEAATVVPVSGRSEYFVPIVVKCLGDPHAFAARWGARFTEEGRAFYSRVLDHYARYFSHPALWQAYWETPESGNMAMNTRTQETELGPAHLGLYELMRLEAQPDERCVLVGYSQGGLVARYLTLLDERLLAPEDRVVAGVLTVHAPNRGSPLARLENRDRVSEGLFRALAGLLRAGTPGPFTRLSEAFTGLATGRLLVERIGRRGATGGLRRHFDIEALVSLLSAAARDLRQNPELHDRHAMRDFVETALKWLSGLVTASGTAFSDLDVENLGRPDSVLGALERHVHAVPHGAVVGGNGKAVDFLSSSIQAPWDVLARWALGRLKERMGLFQTAYRTCVMSEVEAGLPPVARELAARYGQGGRVYGTAEAVDLPAHAHDFVVPSVNQTIGPVWGADTQPVPPRPPMLLGNVLNVDAAHISGAADSSSRRSQRKHVIRLLRAVGVRLE